MTAQKRSENAQDVPVALTAISAEAIANAGLGNLGDLTRMSSSLTIQDVGNRNESPVSLRGIGTYSFAIGVEPSVAIIIDEVPVATTGQAFANLSDIERVEVLRGPQSTLFGKNASAGVINIVTKNPSEEFEGAVEGTLANDDYYRMTGSVSGPITDTIGVRIGAYYDNYDGNIRNVVDGDDLQGSESQGIRGKLVFNPTDVLSVTLIGEYNELDQDSSAYTFREVDPAAAFGGQSPSSKWLAGIKPGDDNFNAAYPYKPQSNSDDTAFSAKVEYDLGEFTIVSVTGYREWNYSNFEDLAGAAVPYGSVLNPSFTMQSEYKIEQKTQELRLVSPASDTFEYIAGLWYSDSDYDRTFQRDPLIKGTNVARSDWVAYAGNTAYSVFGQGTFKLTDSVHVIAGLRYQKEEIEVDFTNNLNRLNPRGDDSDDVVVGKLVGQYFINEDVMAYASYSRGYKGQAYNTTSSFNQLMADNPVGTEDSDAYEIGMKGTFADGRLQVNADVFNVTYEGFQAQGVDASTTNLGFTLNNVGEVETSGVELDVTAMLTDNLMLNVAAAYTDATINDFKGAECYPGQTVALGCVGSPAQQDLSGEDLNNSPDWKYVVGADYNLPLDGMSFDLVAHASYRWQDDVNFALSADPHAVQDSYGILDLSVGLEDKEGRYSVTAFVNNALDETYVTNIQNRTTPFYGGKLVTLQYMPRDAERYAGIRVKYNF